MKKLIIMGFLMAFFGLTAVVVAHTEADPLVRELIADGGDATTAVDVGDVKVWNDATYLYVKYETDAEWPLNETHLDVNGIDPNCIPQKKGNPIPGQFPYQTPWDSGPNFATYRIPLDLDPIMSSNGKKVLVPGHTWIVDDLLYIAAHGVVGICDCEDLLEALPDTITADIVYPGTDSYFVVTITGDGILDGVHKGWCADADDYIEGDAEHVGDVYSTICDDVLDIPEGLIVYDSNLPCVNWLLNNWETLGYTAGDAQAAIWILLSGHLPDDTSSIEYHEGEPWPEDQAFDLTRAQELAEAAEEHDDFWPACGEVMAIIFVPPIFDSGPQEGEPRQTVLIEVPAPCCETIWGGIPGSIQDTDENGYGHDFPGSNWAMYFTYVVQ